MAQNPDIKIEITQLGWNDYWNGNRDRHGGRNRAGRDHQQFLEIVRVREQGPARGSHASDQARQGRHLRLPQRRRQDLGPPRRKVLRLPEGLGHDRDRVQQGLRQGRGRRTKSTIGKLTWNAKDGGTFEKFIAQMSLDKNGRNGLDPKFDAKNVVRYGFAHSRFDANGQPTFSALARSNGWKETDDLYSTNFHFDDQRLIDTMVWYKHVIDKGYMAPFSYITPTNGANMAFAAQKVAVVFDGSWMKDFYTQQSFPIAFKTLPAGPEGVKSFFNGITDSIMERQQEPGAGLEMGEVPRLSRDARRRRQIRRGIPGDPARPRQFDQGIHLPEHRHHGLHGRGRRPPASPSSDPSPTIGPKIDRHHDAGLGHDLPEQQAGRRDSEGREQEGSRPLQKIKKAVRISGLDKNAPQMAAGHFFQFKRAVAEIRENGTGGKTRKRRVMS